MENGKNEKEESKLFVFSFPSWREDVRGCAVVQATTEEEAKIILKGEMMWGNVFISPISMPAFAALEKALENIVLEEVYNNSSRGVLFSHDGECGLIF